MCCRLVVRVVQLCTTTWNRLLPELTVTGPVVERFQAGTELEDAPVLDRPAPLRLLHDADVAYKYPDILTYLRHERRYQFISKCDCAQDLNCCKLSATVRICS